MSHYGEFYEAREHERRKRWGDANYTGPDPQNLDPVELKYRLAVGQKAIRELATLRSILGKKSECG